jgi:hypothetical protein
MPAALPLDAEGRLLDDVPCEACGYVLWGLPPDGHCPECGEPVSASARPDLLRYADAGWVRALRSGLFWLAVSFALAGLSFVAANVLLQVGLFIWTRPLPGWSAVVVRVVTQVLLVGPPIIASVVAYWRWTTPEPGDGGGGAMAGGVARGRWVGRWFAMTAAVVSFGWALAWVLWPEWFLVNPLARFGSQALWLPLALLGIWGLGAWSVHLAGRLSQRRLVRQVRRLTLVWLTLTAVDLPMRWMGVLLLGEDAYFDPTMLPGGGVRLAWTAWLWLWTLAKAAAFVWLLRVMLRLYVGLGRAARAGE